MNSNNLNKSERRLLLFLKIEFWICVAVTTIFAVLGVLSFISGVGDDAAAWILLRFAIVVFGTLPMIILAIINLIILSTKRQFNETESYQKFVFHASFCILAILGPLSMSMVVFLIGITSGQSPMERTQETTRETLFLSELIAILAPIVILISPVVLKPLVRKNARIVHWFSIGCCIATLLSSVVFGIWILLID